MRCGGSVGPFAADAIIAVNALTDPDYRQAKLRGDADVSKGIVQQHAASGAAPTVDRIKRPHVTARLTPEFGNQPGIGRKPGVGCNGAQVTQGNLRTVWRGWDARHRTAHAASGSGCAAALWALWIQSAAACA